MEVTLDKRYPVAAAPAQAWTVLREVRAVAGCMPGAAITEQLDDTHYKGTVKVKVGPATAAFGGDIELKQVDDAEMRMQLLGKGADRAGSTAAMDLIASVEPGETPGTSVLVGHAKVTVNGKFAQFGGRMMVQVSDMILQQFADNFNATAAAQPVPVAAAAPVAAGETATAPGAAEPVAALAPDQSAEGTAVAAEALSAAAAASPPAAPVVVTAPAKELNALAIVWMLIKNWFAGLFRKRA
jgi:uncharacterized protein